MKKFPLYVLMACAVTGCAPRNASRDKVVKETYYHRYGVTLPEKEWHDRGMNGQVVTTLDNGVTVTRTFSEGVLDGQVLSTFPHSKIVEQEEAYVKGNLIKRKLYYPSGSPKFEEEFLSPEAKLVTSWYEDGIPLLVESYIEDKLVEGKYFTPTYEEASAVVNGDGTRIFRDHYGMILSTDIIHGGEMVESTTYHPNGVPKTITPYVRGKIEGTRRTFRPGGEPKTVEEWLSGLQEGITLVFENGERIARIPYHHGEKHGIEKRYSEAERVVEEITWEEGKRQGPTHVFVEGNVKTEWYFDDKIVSKAGYDIMRNPAVR